MSTKEKFFHSGMPGAPTLSGTAGAIITVLDAVLKDGWGSVTVDSVVVASSVATVTRAAGISFVLDQVVLMAGATPSGLNGEKRALSVTATTFTFDATGISDQTATGTITAKVAPLGWDKPYSGTNLAAYRPADVTGLRMYLRVDHTSALTPRVVGYETMSDVNTGTGPFPTATQMSGGLYWPASHTANGTAVNWVIFGDHAGFYIGVQTNTAHTSGITVLYWFGDVIPKKSGDAYCCKISGANASLAAATSSTEDESYSGIAKTRTFLSRSVTQLGSSRAGTSYAPGLVSNQFSGGSSQVFVYPNTADNALYVVQPICAEGVTSNLAIRGLMPGLFLSPQNCVSFFAHLDRVLGVASLTGRAVYAVYLQGTPSLAFFDATGPWR